MEQLNYFGKVTNQNFVTVKPLIIVKGKVKVAIYGIGYIKDYQFSKLINDNKLILEDLDPRNFNILVIHQNRYKGAHFAHERDSMDPIQFRKFNISLIIWGHEHEAKETLEPCEHFHVFQPGSTVATSLIEAEAIIKQAGLLTVGSKETITFESIKLTKSYRPLLYKSIELNEVIKKSSENNNKSLTNQENGEKVLFTLVD